MKETTTTPIKLQSYSFPDLLYIDYHIKHDGDKLSLIPHDPDRTLTVSLNDEESRTSVMSLQVFGGDDTSNDNVNVKALLDAKKYIKGPKKYIKGPDEGNIETMNEAPAPAPAPAQEPAPVQEPASVQKEKKKKKGLFRRFFGKNTQGGKKRTHKNKRKSMRKKSMKKKPRKTMKKKSMKKKSMKK